MLVFGCEPLLSMAEISLQPQIYTVLHFVSVPYEQVFFFKVNCIAIYLLIIHNDKFPKDLYYKYIVYPHFFFLFPSVRSLSSPRWSHFYFHVTHAYMTFMYL